MSSHLSNCDSSAPDCVGQRSTRVSRDGSRVSRTSGAFSPTSGLTQDSSTQGPGATWGGCVYRNLPPFLACSGHALRSHFPFIQATLRGPKAKLAHGDALEAAGLGSGRHGQVCSGQNGLGGHFRGGWSGELSCCAGPQRLLLLQGPRGPESRPGDTHPPPREPWQVQPELPAASVFSSVCFFSEMR